MEGNTENKSLQSPKKKLLERMRMNLKQTFFQEEESSPEIEDHINLMKISIQKFKKENFYEKPLFKQYQKDFSSDYQMKEKIGEGTSGVVRKCTKIKNQKDYAVKILKISEEEIATKVVEEFTNLKKINHPNIVKVHKLYIDKERDKIYYVMEYVPAKEMLEVLKELNQYSETIAAKIFKKLLSAIEYLHSQGICHRDLKPSNILCDEEGNLVKITDFNISKFTQKISNFYFNLAENDNKMWTNTGTVQYMAPEIFKNDYNHQVDIWSVGVVLYLMLSGRHPFEAEYVEDLISLITKGKFEFPNDLWSDISPKAVDLVIQCLTLDPNIRITAVRALEHPWIAEKISHKSPKLIPKTTIMNLEEIFKHMKRNKSTKRRLNTIASPKPHDNEDSKFDFKLKLERGEESDNSPTMRKSHFHGEFDVEEI